MQKLNGSDIPIKQKLPIHLFIRNFSPNSSIANVIIHNKSGTITNKYMTLATES